MNAISKDPAHKISVPSEMACPKLLVNEMPKDILEKFSNRLDEKIDLESTADELLKRVVAHAQMMVDAKVKNNTANQIKFLLDLQKSRR